MNQQPDIKEQCYEEGCLFEEPTALVTDPTGVIHEVELSKLPDFKDDPLWVRIFRWFF